MKYLLKISLKYTKTYATKKCTAQVPRARFCQTLEVKPILQRGLMLPSIWCINRISLKSYKTIFLYGGVTKSRLSNATLQKRYLEEISMMYLLPVRQ
jgi:hypothetical protein